MKNVAIIYWSGTGNTQKMAVALAEGAKSQGAEVNIMPVHKASVEDVLRADTVALGCPSMGCEELEETQVEPFVEKLEKEDIKGKGLLLFGSYDWGDGQWMKDWRDRMISTGVRLMNGGLIIQNTPDQGGVEKCKTYGAELAMF